jgi:hypothetical protein
MDTNALRSKGLWRSLAESGAVPNKPNLRLSRCLGLAPPGAVPRRTNKANFRASSLLLACSAECHTCAYKQSQFSQSRASARLARRGGGTQLCKTKPIGAAAVAESTPETGSPRSTGIPSASLSGQALPVNLDYGRDGDAKREEMRLGNPRPYHCTA